ncbi:MAG: dihydrolipoamide acetyltransferase family protein, partial [Chitinophagales bacterium]
MADVVRMPKMSDTMTEGVIIAWHKKVGDKIKSGDLLAEIETDKAVMEFESFQEGILLYIGPEKGQSVKVDDVIAVLGKEGEDYKALLQSADNGTPQAKAEVPAKEVSAEKESVKVEKPEEAVVEDTAADKESGRIKASPLAKKIASESGVAISKIKGSGDEGRIVKRDVEKFLTESPAATKKATAPAALGEESFEEVAVSQMRKTIAKRLAESKFSAPHFYLTMEINMDRSVDARTALNKEFPDGKISFNDIIIKAAALALKKNPKVNSSWLTDKIRYNH